MADSIGTELQKRIDQLLDAQVKVVDLTKSIDKAVIEFKTAGTITEATLEAFSRTANSATNALGELAKLAGSLPSMKSEIDSAVALFRETVSSMQAAANEIRSSASEASRTIGNTPDELRAKLEAMLSDFDRRLMEGDKAANNDQTRNSTSTFSGRLDLVVPSATIAYLVAYFGFGLEVRDAIVLTFASFGGVLAGVSSVRIAREAAEIIKGLSQRKGR